jgi:probable DNA metabolism protein
MIRVRFTGGWTGWRTAARARLAAGDPPERLLWDVLDEGEQSPELFDFVSQPGGAGGRADHPASRSGAGGGQGGDTASNQPDADGGAPYLAAAGSGADHRPPGSAPAPAEPPLAGGSEATAGARDGTATHGEQFGGESAARTETSPARVPGRFLRLAEAAAHHADPARWSLLYRSLWRITHGEPHLMELEVDPDVRRLIVMERAVRRASHKMKAFVRFRATGGEDDPYVAWFEPEHPVLERVAPFFARRFAGMRWSVLTPQRCAHWDGETLRFTPGVPRSAAPAGDALEELWRTYYANIFNPARLNARAMQAELPKMYWKNLPEARLIEQLRREAPVRARRMVERESTPDTEPALRPRRPREP